MSLSDPYTMFLAWYAEAQRGAVQDPNIIALATATAEGRPAVRMVLYRGFREGGFSFFTNYESRKGHHLAENPFAAMVFYWSHLGKQVRIEGRVERLSAEESDRYFRQRPFGSRVTANVSRQSRPLLDEREFLRQLTDVETASDKADELPRSSEWGGYKLLPSLYEFWTHRDNRRHERLQFEKSGDQWVQTRLYP
jgi:pyridoxamine 5'-phosphate oxidase